MKEYPSIDDYKMKLFEAAFEAGGYDNVTIALLECMSVKEVNLATTAPPDAPKRRKSKPQPQPKTDGEESGSEDAKESKKSRGWLKALIVLVVLLIVAGAAYYYYEYIYKLKGETEEVAVPKSEEVVVEAPIVQELETVEAPEAAELAEPNGEAATSEVATEEAPAEQPAAESKTE